MIILAILASLQLPPVDSGLDAEGVALGRLSSGVAICSEMGYAANEAAARTFVDAFEVRAKQDGWTSENLQDAYGRGQELERNEVGILFNFAGLNQSQVRRAYVDMLRRAKTRCRALAGQYPGAISDLGRGDRAIDAELAQMRR